MKDKETSREQLLSESLELCQQLVERDRILNLLNDLICVMGVDGYFKYLNQAWERTLGYSREELLLMSVFDFVHYDDRHKNHEDLLAILASGKQNIDYENHLIHKDGSIRIVSWTATPLSEEGLIYCIGRDITERKRVEVALQESEQKLRNIIEHSNELYYVHDTNHVLSYISPQSIRMFGYTPNEMMIEWTKLATENPINKKGIQNTEKALKTGERQPPYLLELYKKDRSKVFLEIDESPLKDEQGNIIGMVGAACDVTERLKVEVEIKKRVKELEDFYDMAVGRELRMIQLKEEIEALKKELIQYKKQ